MVNAGLRETQIRDLFRVVTQQWLTRHAV